MLNQFSSFLSFFLPSFLPNFHVNLVYLCVPSSHCFGYFGLLHIFHWFYWSNKTFFYKGIFFLRGIFVYILLKLWSKRGRIRKQWVIKFHERKYMLRKIQVTCWPLGYHREMWLSLIWWPSYVAICLWTCFYSSNCLIILNILS